MIGGIRGTGITVTFAGLEVVKGVDLELVPGEIHAVVGENGAGKSSLAKALAGVYRPSSGQISTWDGTAYNEVRFRGPLDAQRTGVALIHQEPQSFPDLSIAENIFAGHWPASAIAWNEIWQRASELCSKVNLSINPRTSVGELSIAQRQLVEVAGALAHDARVWIFDETTAPLTPMESEELFAVMQGLADQGCAVMMVTHHLHEVFANAKRITVMRDGVKVAERLTSESNEREIVKLMVGRDIEPVAHKLQAGYAAPLLSVRQLNGPGFQGVTFDVCPGEVVGMAGLVGSGRSEVARCLFGVTHPSRGTILFEGKEVTLRDPRSAVSLGMALVPEDRRGESLVLPHSISFNATLANLRRLAPKCWVTPSRLNAEAQAYADRLNLAHRNLAQPVGQLSGGNQQKVVLSKWLMTRPKLIILDEPTRGVDIGAKLEVHALIRQMAQEGIAVLVISSDLPEVLALSDRVLVMRGGRLAESLAKHEANEESIMLAATGQVEGRLA